jgi:hypothetical protein
MKRLLIVAAFALASLRSSSLEAAPFDRCDKNLLANFMSHDSQWKAVDRRVTHDDLADHSGELKPKFYPVVEMHAHRGKLWTATYGADFGRQRVHCSPSGAIISLPEFRIDSAGGRDKFAKAVYRYNDPKLRYSLEFKTSNGRINSVFLHIARRRKTGLELVESVRFARDPAARF